MQASHGLNEYYSRFRSPFGDVLAMLGSAQADKRCREMELNVLDCTDVFGHTGLLRQCKDQYEDFKECIYEFKQENRVQEMRKERMRQYLQGERTKKNLYAEPPPMDSYFKTYHRNID